MICRGLPDWLILAAICATALWTDASGARAEPVQLAHFIVGVPERREHTSELAWTEAVAEIQGTLFELGFYKGPIDGRLSPQTMDALQAYRRRHGVIDTDATWQTMLTHMRAIGEAMRLQDSLKAARDRQLEEAKAKLLGHAAARSLVRDGAFRETADPTHDSSACFAAPTLRCLIDETLENIRAVSREKYRNWALQDLIGVLARAGLMEPMKDAVRRLTDARLILVSIRDGATAMAVAGRMDLAEETIALLPEGRDRIRALTALARGWLARGEQGAAKEVAERLIGELRGVGEGESRASAAAEAAVIFARSGDAVQARRIIEAGAGPLDAAMRRDSAVRASAALVLAELGETDSAVGLIAGIPQGSVRRSAEMALIAAYARNGSIERAVDTANAIDIARYRVVALCEATRILAEARRESDARRSLKAAIEHLAAVEGEYAIDYALSCIAEAHARLGEVDRAEAAASHIEGSDLKARTYWRLLALRRAAGDDQAAGDDRATEALERAATAVTETVDTFKRVSILSDVAAIFGRSGREAEARALLGQAIGIVRDVKSRWWRARALCRIAAAMIVLESLERDR